MSGQIGAVPLMDLHAGVNSFHATMVRMVEEERARANALCNALDAVLRAEGDPSYRHKCEIALSLVMAHRARGVIT